MTYNLLGSLAINLQDFNSFNPLEILPDFLLNSDSSSLIDLPDSYKLNNNFNLNSELITNFNKLKSSKSEIPSKYISLITIPPSVRINKIL